MIELFLHTDIIFDPNTPNGNPNNNALRGRRLRAWYGGKQVDLTVVDRCEACREHDIDLSPSAFQVFAGLEVGVVHGSWEWI
jgi:hypothetical protein